MYRLLAEHSPLTRLPAGLEPRHRVWLEAIRFSVQIAEVHYNRLLVHCSELATNDKAMSEFSTAIAMADAWGFVDAAHRIAKLLNAIPRAPKGASSQPPRPAERAHATPRFKDTRRAYLADIEAVEELRNFVQHLDERRDATATTQLPVWGSLSWVVRTSPERCKTCVLYAGGGNEFTMNVQNPAARAFHGAVDHVELEAHGWRIPISVRARAIADVAGHLERILAPQFEGHTVDFPGGLLVVELEFVQEDGAAK